MLTPHGFLEEGHLMQPGGGVIHAQQVSCVDRHSIHRSRGLSMQQLVNQGLSEAWGKGSAGLDDLQPREHMLGVDAGRIQGSCAGTAPRTGSSTA